MILEQRDTALFSQKLFLETLVIILFHVQEAPNVPIKLSRKSGKGGLAT
jgi:hypothetical protein